MTSPSAACDVSSQSPAFGFCLVAFQTFLVFICKKKKKKKKNKEKSSEPVYLLATIHFLFFLRLCIWETSIIVFCD